MKSSTDHSVLGTALGAGDTVRNQRDQSPCFQGAYILVEIVILLYPRWITKHESILDS